MTAYLYDWNMLPIGQLLWLKELRPTWSSRRCRSRRAYNLSRIMEQVKKAAEQSRERLVERQARIDRLRGRLRKGRPLRLSKWI